ncbi:MAG: hypothetical protein DMD91_11640 [Candidatus Rokuibacteriota bacterium]|nr:MAG: hypothetical protein DMD91_11640 [Candidatus Rokubacteria bacterium]
MSYVGQSLKRREDERLLQGRGVYVADVQRPGTLHLAMVRSPHAHARIRAIDAAAARACPGVVDVVTFDDVPELARAIPMRMSERGQMNRYLQRPLARDKVRYVGEPVAVVVATDRYRAEDALARVQVDYDPLPALVDTRAAGEPGAPLLFESHGTNVVATYTVAYGDVERALREADLVLRETMYVQRHAGVPMETRGAMAEWDAGRGVLSMWGMTKVPHVNRRIIAEHAGLPEHGVRFLQTDVGGAFGVRGEVYPEDFLVALLAIRTRRPVRWIEDRREHLQAANHSREQHHEIAIALRRDGTILGIDDRFWNNMGAYVRTHGATVPNNTAGYVPGPYRVPHYRAEVTCVVTNKTPAGTYRAPGRFEATFVGSATSFRPRRCRTRSAPPPSAARSSTTVATSRSSSGGRSTGWITGSFARSRPKRAGPDFTSASGSRTSWRSRGSAPGNPRASSWTAPARSSSTRVSRPWGRAWRRSSRRSAPTPSACGTRT